MKYSISHVQEVDTRSVGSDDQSLVLLVSSCLEIHTTSLQEKVGNEGGNLLLHLAYLK